MATMAEVKEATDESIQTIILAKRGDVILCVGKDDERVKLLVSASLMSFASSVFEVMFDGRFFEGQGLSPANPREVSLPDDDPQSMSLLCRIIHMQTADIPPQLEVVALADFAVLCDKYNCIDSVRPWGRVWVLELLPKPATQGYEKLLMIAYVLDLPDEFYKVTQSLLRNRTFSVDLEVAAHGADFIPLSIFGTLACFFDYQ